MALSRRRIVYLVLLVLAVGIILGSSSGKLVQAFKDRKYERVRELTNKKLQDNLDFPKAGDTLPDHLFETLGQDSVWLSSLLGKATMISIISPDCGACVEEIIRVKEMAADSLDQSRFVFISSGNPRYL